MILKYKSSIKKAFISVAVFFSLFSCHDFKNQRQKIVVIISDYIKDSLSRAGYKLDSIQIFKMDTITEQDLIFRQIQYHDAMMRRMEELSSMQLSHQFLSFSKYKFFIQTGDSVNAARIQKDMTQQTLAGSRFSDSAQLYKHISDSLRSLGSTDSTTQAYYKVFYKQFSLSPKDSLLESSSSVIMMPDYTIKHVERTRDLVRNQN